MSESDNEGSQGSEDEQDIFLGINFSRLRETFFFKDFFYDEEKDEPVNKAIKVTS